MNCSILRTTVRAAHATNTGVIVRVHVAAAAVAATDARRGPAAAQRDGARGDVRRIIIGAVDTSRSLAVQCLAEPDGR